MFALQAQLHGIAGCCARGVGAGRPAVAATAAVGAAGVRHAHVQVSHPPFLYLKEGRVVAKTLHSSDHFLLQPLAERHHRHRRLRGVQGRVRRHEGGEQQRRRQERQRLRRVRLRVRLRRQGLQRRSQGGAWQQQMSPNAATMFWCVQMCTAATHVLHVECRHTCICKQHAHCFRTRRCSRCCRRGAVTRVRRLGALPRRSPAPGTLAPASSG